MEYEIQPHTRRCVMTGRELNPGERYYAALIEDGARFVRHDYSAEAWTGPPEGTFSFWAGRVPPPQEEARLRVDDDLLEDCFQRLEGQTDPGRINFRYVVALLLMRRKRLKFVSARTESGGEVLRLRDARTGAEHDVANPGLSDDEMASVQEEVLKVLGWE